MTAGQRVGTQFHLAEDKQNRIGRGLECDVILADPLSSRVHAIVTCETGDWWVRELKGEYFPAVSLEDPAFRRLLESQGWLPLAAKRP